jgi:hypothetical protein
LWNLLIDERSSLHRTAPAEHEPIQTTSFLILINWSNTFALLRETHLLYRLCELAFDGHDIVCQSPHNRMKTL